jgi:hypothetical protein
MRLAPVFAAQYNALSSPSGCLQGTRVDVLEIFFAWSLQSVSALHIYWLAGHAGTGKSAIAKTLSERLVGSNDTLVVTFFVSKNSEDRRDPLRMLHTIVHRLAHMSVLVRTNVVKVLSSEPDIIQRALNEQIKLFLLEPLREPTKTHSIIIVVDALDECLSVRGVEGGSLVHDLANTLGSLPIKLVVTSRLEQSLQRMFNKLPSKNVKLHEIEGEQVSDDVRLILENGFEAIAQKHQISTRPWPPKEDIDELVKRTGRLIIFAVTVLNFVDSERFSARKQLAQILMQKSVANDRDEYKLVDELYLNVLEMAARRTQDAKHADPVLCARLRALIGTVILLYKPMSIPALAKLMSLDEDDVSRDVHALSAVLLVGPDIDDSGASLVRIFHPSFRDYLLERCSDPRFSIDITQQHRILSAHCLRSLNERLKQDICGIKDPTIPHLDIVNPILSIRLLQHVDGATRYACQFWISHIAFSGNLDVDLLLVLRTFVAEHILHWIELLGLTGTIYHAVQSFANTVSWSQVSESIPQFDQEAI